MWYKLLTCFGLFGHLGNDFRNPFDFFFILFSPSTTFLEIEEAFSGQDSSPCFLNVNRRPMSPLNLSFSFLHGKNSIIMFNLELLISPTSLVTPNLSLNQGCHLVFLFFLLSFDIGLSLSLFDEPFRKISFIVMIDDMTPTRSSMGIAGGCIVSFGFLSSPNLLINVWNFDFNLNVVRCLIKRVAGGVVRSSSSSWSRLRLRRRLRGRHGRGQGKIRPPKAMVMTRMGDDGLFLQGSRRRRGLKGNLP